MKTNLLLLLNITVTHYSKKKCPKVIKMKLIVHVLAYDYRVLLYDKGHYVYLFMSNNAQFCLSTEIRVVFTSKHEKCKLKYLKTCTTIETLINYKCMLYVVL